MPDTAIVAALTSLIPSFPASNKPFPPLLLSQSESFLALSRQRASHLKPEEEIARAHACAEIACNRLRAQLRLPAIKNGAGAPCKPKVYAKLLAFLDGSLGDANLGSLTPRGRKRDGQGNLKDTPGSVSGRTSAVGTPSRKEPTIEDTPSKKRVVSRDPGAKFAGVVKSSKNARNSTAANEDKAPQFALPSIRKLCAMFSTPLLTPHVYTGTCVALELAELWSHDTEVDEALKSDVLALVVAVYLMVLTRMQVEEMTTDVYTDVSGRGAEALGLSAEAVEDVEHWINRLNDEGWCSGQSWWESVPEGVFEFGLDEGAVSMSQPGLDEEDMTGRENFDGIHGRGETTNLEEDPEGVLLPGLGTMLHEGIDWTSEHKCLDFEDWYASVSKKPRTPVKSNNKRGRAVAVV